MKGDEGRRRGRAAVLGARIAAALALTAGEARAHEFRPALLDVTSAGAGRFEIVWSAAPGMESAQIVFPACCGRLTEGAAAPPGASERRFLVDCGEVGLSGQTLAVAGLAPLRDEVLVRVRLEGGAETSAMLTAARPSFVVPGAEPAAGASGGGSGWTGTAGRFAATGAAHLVTGPDHVLFVIGLLLLVRRAGALVRAITAFTVAHSLTLALQVLGAVRLPPAPVEAAIALSVLLVARELLRPPEARTLLHRRPWVAAFAFGLLHGLGFAGGLGALRVPAGEIPAALLGFNVGLEAAQLAVVAAALLAGRALRPVAARRPALARLAPAYGLGACAAFWTIERAAALWRG